MCRWSSLSFGPAGMDGGGQWHRIAHMRIHGQFSSWRMVWSQDSAGILESRSDNHCPGFCEWC
ncbi:hypothetical protein L837_4685 [Mycobacterium avium MAV_061107_1842]|nr:hypothetical protein L837_4685 [Mycobacterium avium MAV_061107_1842]